jgi:hypothetical protein
MNNIGELFKILNLEICNKFYENVNDDNKKDIIDNMINNEEFMSLVNPIMNDLDMLKNKIDTKLSAIIKKNMKDIIKPIIKEDKPIITENSYTCVEEKGNHIGSGIYLERVDHLIKMTTPDFVCYY